MSNESRMQNVEQQLARYGPVRPCNCTGEVFVIPDATGRRAICDKCGGDVQGPASMRKGSIPEPWYPGMKIEGPSGTEPPE